MTTELKDDDLVLDGSSPTLTIDIVTIQVSSSNAFDAPTTIGDWSAADHEWINTKITVPPMASIRELIIEKVSPASGLASEYLWVANYDCASQEAYLHGRFYVNGTQGWCAPNASDCYQGYNLATAINYQGHGHLKIITFGMGGPGRGYEEVKEYSGDQVWIQISGSGDIDGGTAASLKCHVKFDVWDFD